MNKYEVLVHITAPSAAKDDARYYAQAAAIVQFCSNEKEKISSVRRPASPSVNHPSNDDASCDGLRTQQTEDISTLGDVIKLISSFEKISGSRISMSRRESYSDLENEIITALDGKNNLSHEFGGDSMLALGDPFNTNVLQEKARRGLQVLRTPESPRPRTAPTVSGSSHTPSSFKAWVPDTARPLHPRALKRSFSEQDFNSPETVLGSGLRNRLNTEMDALPRPAACGLGNVPSHETERLNSIEPIKRRKVSVGEITARDALWPHEENGVEEKDVNESSSQDNYSSDLALATPSLHRALNDIQFRSRTAALGRESASTMCFLIPYREYDWTSSPSSYDDHSDSSADNDESTASPSQLQDITEIVKPQNSGNSTIRSPPRKQTSPIDLTSPTTPTETPSKAVISNRAYQAPVSDPSSVFCGPIDTKLKDSVFVYLRSLPTEIFPPPPPTGDSIVQSHMTRGYASITTTIPIYDNFRPVSVVRDMHRFERGYWALSVKVIHDSVITEGNALDVWCQSDFAKLYCSLQRHITGRTSDWSVRVFLEVPSSPSHVSTSGNEVPITLKTTCNAEVIPHVFLLLWILSDKRTGRMGMCWYGADNAVVVKMGRDGLDEASEMEGAKRGEKMFRGKKTWQSKENGLLGASERVGEEES